MDTFFIQEGMLLVLADFFNGEVNIGETSDVDWYWKWADEYLHSLTLYRPQDAGYELAINSLTRLFDGDSPIGEGKRWYKIEWSQGTLMHFYENWQAVNNLSGYRGNWRETVGG